MEFSTSNDNKFIASGGDIWVMNKLNDLFVRCGASPVVANIGMSLHFDEQDKYHYSLIRPDSGQARNEKEAEAIEKAIDLLGFGKKMALDFQNLEAVEEAVDHALSLAPRASVRNR